MDTGSGTQVSDLGQCGQAVAGRLIEIGLRVDAGGGQVVDAAGSTSDTHRGVSSGAARNCMFPAECLIRIEYQRSVPRSVPPVTADEGAVQDHERHTFASALFQNLNEIRRLYREDVDAFVKNAVSGGLRDTRVAARRSTHV
ncbi:hypothetical protein OG965_38350 [Streptomyces sp. NBC_00224]|uniref:Uncharacterized protein n=1 Tax=Streptomyces sp. NBC_00060 TaxID=2975636 RepID=A0AAU2GSK5_9ACTN